VIVEYRVLGPLEVIHNGEPVALPAGRGRVLLATLLLRANEFVTVDELVDRVWDGAPPEGDRAYKTFHMTVSRLRQALGAANCIQTSSRGYSAEVAPGQLDLARFRALTAQGEHRAALELWRGPVLANVTSEALHRDDVPRLVEEQVVALERRIDQDLSRDADVLVPELRSLVKKHPLRETFWAQLMLALHRSNRQAEALAAYQEVRDHLADELGVDPGPRLRHAHEQVLSGEVPTAALPRQLPAGVPHFVGREHELARLTELLTTRPGEPVLISAINGIGGVGKTALALRWAHQVADRFPDGQLYVNLRGFDTRAEPLEPFSVVRDFLVALGVATGDIPSSEDALVAAYRSALAQRQVLLVLDNARDAEQVRPLLPGGAGNLVLITSRNRLKGLVAREGAQPVALDVLDEQAAVDLLGERIGAARVAAEPDAVSRLVKRCAGLPLALGIVAARAAFGDSLTTLVDELEQERLDALDLDDPATGVRAVFSWSLRSVSDHAARVFVLLGLHPGPDFAVEAVASLAALPRAEARRVLAELASNSLVSTSGSGRYALHDLLRDYAAERVAQLPDAERAQAWRRLVDHYFHTTHGCWTRTSDVVNTAVPSPPAPGVLVLGQDWDRDESFAWFAAEHAVLIGLLDRVEDDLVWRLVQMQHTYSGHRLALGSGERTYRAGLAAAQRTGDIYAQSRMHRFLGARLLGVNELGAAEHHLRQALHFDALAGDVRSELNVACGLAYTLERQHRYQDMLEALLHVHPRSLNHNVAYDVASHLGALGRAYYRVGDVDRALEHCGRAAELFAGLEHLPDIDGGENQEILGEIHLQLGRPEEAVRCYSESVRLHRVNGNVRALTESLVPLAKVHLAAGDRASARERLAEHLALCAEVGYGDTAETEELMASLD
jgi:DNA-binding SARP family transcriptional activator/tetratricopeptide (TPR) repeat protein